MLKPRLFRPNNWENTCTTHTNQGLGNPCRFMLPLCSSLQSQPTPHKHALQLHCPLHTQNPKRSTTKSSYSVPTLQNLLQETFVPPLWQPPTVINHHKTTQDQVFWCLHLLFNFLLSKDSSVHFFAQIRIAAFWTITVCCYLQICVHVHAARFGDVWNSFPGFAWYLGHRRQNRNQIWTWVRNKIQQQKHVPFEVPWLQANASHYKM